MSDKQARPPSAQTVGPTHAPAVVPWLRLVPGVAPSDALFLLPQAATPGQPPPDVPHWMIYAALFLFCLGATTGLLSAVVGMRAKPPTYIYVQAPCDARVDPACPTSP